MQNQALPQLRSEKWATSFLRGILGMEVGGADVTSRDRKGILIPGLSFRRN